MFLENETEVMGISKSYFICDVCAPERCRQQQVFRFIDTDPCKIFNEGLPGLLGKDGTEMVWTYVYSRCH